MLQQVYQGIEGRVLTEGGTRALDPRVRYATEVFLELLRRFNAENRHVSNNLGPTYAPALFAREESVRRAGLSSASLTGAMRRLFEAKKIFNEPHGKRSRERFHIVIRP